MDTETGETWHLLTSTMEWAKVGEPKGALSLPDLTEKLLRES